jgi:hypothetical protein
MNPRRAILTIFFALGLSLVATADPLNFMVGNFTFSRPSGWRWEELVAQSKATAQLRVTDEKTGGESQVLISISHTPRDEIAAKWKIYFVEPPVVVHNVSSNKVKSFPVTWVSVEGTYRVRGVLKPDHSLLGAIIETEKGNVFGRIVGPKELVQKSTPTFKKMIEDALKEE